jgi:hypothetical protein
MAGWDRVGGIQEGGYMSHPFEVGKTYRNRIGEYVVQAIDGESMKIRYTNGKTQDTRVVIQARIWENIQFEEQMARQEERERLSREARMAARKRKARARRARAQPRFQGFEESDFEPKQRGIAWSSRKELGKVLAQQLGQRATGEFDHWIVPRQSRVHVARKEVYDLDARDRNAALFVAAGEGGITYGYRVGKPDGKAADSWPWAQLLAALSDDALRRALRATMKEHDLTMDLYAENVSYGQVGQISVQARGFLWQHQTAEQDMTRRMNWDALIEYLQTEGAERRCDLYLCKRLPVSDALGAGEEIAKEIVSLFEALLPVYDASVGVVAS